MSAVEVVNRLVDEASCDAQVTEQWLDEHPRASLPLGEAAARWTELEKHRRELDETLKEVKRVQERLAAEQLIEQMQVAGLTSLNTSDFTVLLDEGKDTIHVRRRKEIPADDMIAALREHGLGDLCGEDYSASKLKAQVVHWLMQGEEIPPDLAEKLDVVRTPRVRARVRR